MMDKITRKAQIIHALLVRNYKDSGLTEELSQIFPEKNWELTSIEVEQALRIKDNPLFVLEKQFEKMAQLLGCDEQDSRLVGLRARFNATPDGER